MTAPPLAASSLPDLSAIAPRPRVAPPANASLVGRDSLTPTLAMFTVRPDGGSPPFVAGQYVQLRSLEPETPPRPYSIASPPNSRDLKLLVSLVEGGAFTPRLFELPLGSRLYVGVPAGRFRLEGEDARDHLLVATGSGIAPFLSMVAALSARQRPPRTILSHGVRTEDELAGRPELEGYDGTWLTYRPSLSRPRDSVGWRGLRGRVGDHLRDLVTSQGFRPDHTVAYLCGNPSMIADCEAGLLEMGVPGANIRTERFTAKAAD